MSPQTLTLRVGEKATLGVSVATTGGAATTVTWSSSTPAVASVSATGEVTAVAAGNTTVRAVSTVDGSKSGAAQVTVSALAVRSVSVSPQSLSLQIGQTATAVATVDRDAGVAGTVTWASNNAAVATVNATSGLITAVAAGTAVISATSTVDNTKSSALAVTVVSVPNNLSALSVAPTSANLGIGSTLQLVPSATTVGSPTVTYTYATSNNLIATVSSTGVVTAVGNGTAVITTTATTNTNSLSVATTINVASASVSISSITFGNTATPVNIANVFGQIEVTMNINAGNQTLDSVRVKLGSKSAASQAFTVNGAPNAPVTLSINTAAYTLNGDLAAIVSFLNGSTGVQAELFVSGASGPTASNT
ncbi:MAG: Ig-like domain-containing protein, partial [Cytophagaceae bacterium]|nr:Ig-like domain-containing protein [Gemmatimonadaceae bacterium]